MTEKAAFLRSTTKEVHRQDTTRTILGSTQDPTTTANRRQTLSNSSSRKLANEIAEFPISSGRLASNDQQISGLSCSQKQAFQKARRQSAIATDPTPSPNRTDRLNRRQTIRSSLEYSGNPCFETTLHDGRQKLCKSCSGNQGNQIVQYLISVGRLCNNNHQASGPSAC